MSLDLTHTSDDAVSSTSPAARILLVLPTVGGPLPLVERTLDSLLDQHAEPADVVIVAPPTADGVRDVARAHGVTVVDDPGRGLAAAVNAGFAGAGPQHVYGNWVGSPDILLPGALATAARRLDDDPSAVVAYGDCRILEGGEYLRTPHAGPLSGWMLGWGPERLAQPAALLRLAAVAAVGGLDERLRYAVDLDLLLRLRRQGRFVSTGRTLAVFEGTGTRPSAQDRAAAAAEVEQVRRRYLPRQLSSVAPVWERPVRLFQRRERTRAERTALYG